jgi:hypothetical protein
MSPNYRLRLAAAGCMLMTLVCNFAQGRHPVPLLVAGQIAFGLATLVLAIMVMVSTVKQSS